MVSKREIPVQLRMRMRLMYNWFRSLDSSWLTADSTLLMPCRAGQFT